MLFRFGLLAQGTLRQQPLSWRRLLSSTSLRDPSRPDIYYHLVHRSEPPSPSYALSFLPEPPATEHSETVLGYLPAATLSGETEEAGLNDFVQNRQYLKRSLKGTVPLYFSHYTSRLCRAAP